MWARMSSGDARYVGRSNGGFMRFVELDRELIDDQSGQQRDRYYALLQRGRATCRAELGHNPDAERARKLRASEQAYQTAADLLRTLWAQHHQKRD